MSALQFHLQEVSSEQFGFKPFMTNMETTVEITGAKNGSEI